MKKIYSVFALLMAVVLFSCSNKDEAAGRFEESGFLTLDIRSVSTTYTNTTRALPADYDARKLHAEIVDKNGAVVASTDDVEEWSSKTFPLLAGTYTVSAHSAKWDGMDAGRDVPYYAGSATVKVSPKQAVTAEVVCTQANVKVSVEFDNTVKTAFKTVAVDLSSAVLPNYANQSFVMGLESSMRPAYFPVGKITAKLHVENYANQTFDNEYVIEDVKARDHFILKYTTDKTGTGIFNVSGDGSETGYTYTFSVPVKASTTLNVNNVNAWSSFAWIEGSIPTHDITIDNDKVKFQYKKATDADWSEAATTLDGETYKATLKGLTPATTYAVKMVYSDGEHNFASSEKVFETEAQTLLPNGNLDNWSTGTFNGKSCVYPNAAGESFWDTSNPGSSLMNKMVTTQETTDVHTAGGSAARLGSQYIVIKFAAASMYAGSFGELKGTSGAAINFGQPWTTRPTQLKGWFKYSGGAINRNGGAPAGVDIKTGITPDLWSAYVVLADEGYSFDNTNIAGTAWNYETDPRVIAYGAVPDEDCVNADAWTQFTVNLKYHDLKRKPKTIMIVFSSSKYGDYFTGCDSSVLLLDDLELVYGEPQQ